MAPQVYRAKGAKNLPVNIGRGPGLTTTTFVEPLGGGAPVEISGDGGGDDSVGGRGLGLVVGGVAGIGGVGLGGLGGGTELGSGVGFGFGGLGGVWLMSGLGGLGWVEVAGLGRLELGLGKIVGGEWQ
ncbi:acanthoscurrin-2-like [Mangifera indica]|uniref:acanthoscurrin-2-like n=1 Tax=Mangifera indica TaxID=29780 RepID=UPI001CFBE1DA|nr:acanthoscurrin-2-like [Mangifera indica]